MVVEWSREKAREAAEAKARSSELVSVWRGAMGWAWWIAPLTFCAALTFFGVVWLLRWPTIGHGDNPGVLAAVAGFCLLLSLPAFSLVTAIAALLPRLLRPPLLAAVVAMLVVFAR